MIKEKLLLLNLVEKENPDVLDICSIFDNTLATQEDIGKGRIKLVNVMYGMVCLLCFSIRISDVFQTNVCTLPENVRKLLVSDVFKGCKEKEFYQPEMG